MAKSGTLASVVTGVVAFLVGLSVCFFTIGPAMFADGPTSERFVVLGVGALIMFGLGMAGGALAPRRYRLVGVWLAAPAVLVFLFFAVSGELPIEFILLGVAFVVAYFAAALFGAWLAARMRLRKLSDAPAEGSMSEPRV